MNNLKFILKYISYYISAKNRYKIHSPFIYDLLINAVYYEHYEPEFDKFEEIRHELLNNENILIYSDFGAKGISSSVKRKIKYIAKNSSTTEKYSQLLFKLVRYFEPKTLLELGSAFGISTMYQALAATKGKIITIEGSKEIADIARQNFIKLGLVNIEIINDTFDNALPGILSSIKKLDYAFFDGNHRKEATIKYFELCLNKVVEDTIFIFDDIHWSNEMEEAWKYIINHNKVTVTLDLFFMGLVFFSKNTVKQHHKIRF